MGAESTSAAKERRRPPRRRSRARAARAVRSRSSTGCSARSARGSSIDLVAATGDGSIRSFGLPDDLFLIGTMNLIDQSVEQLDFALRRRFLCEESRFDADVLMRVLEQRWDARR
jgi:hypothetical protein